MAQGSSTAIAMVVAALVVAAALGFLALSIKENNPATQAEAATRTIDEAQSVTDIRSALKNAAAAEESFAAESQGTYTSSLAELTNHGLRLPRDITLIPYAVGSGYCIEASHASITGVWRYSSDEGQPSRGGC